MSDERKCECGNPLPAEGPSEGRDNSFPDKCDVCWWRSKSEKLEAEQVYLLQDIRNILGDLSGKWTDAQLRDTIQGLVDFKRDHTDPDGVEKEETTSND